MRHTVLNNAHCEKPLIMTRSTMFEQRCRRPVAKSIGGCLIAGSLLSGCTTQVWAPKTVSVAHTSSRTVHLESSFKRSADSDIFNGRNFAIRKALEKTIAKNGIFSQVISSDNADYQLEVIETYASEPPMFGGNVSLEVEWKWCLKRGKSNEIVWQETIRTTGEGTFTHSALGVVGAVRVAEAKKSAVRQNIKTGLEHISALSNL